MIERLTDEQLREWRDRYPAQPYAEQWSGRTLIDELLELRALWRERGRAFELKEKELDTLSASHEDLAHRLARMGEALATQNGVIVSGARKLNEAREALAELLAELEGPINSRTGPRIERARAALEDKP
jgi:chromosome segregation ATPase